MKISSREKTLLFALAFGLTGFGYYKVVWNYQYNNIKSLEAKRQDIKNKYETDLKMIKSIDSNKEEINMYNSKIQSLTSGFYANIAQPNIILDLNNLMTNNNVKGTMSFSQVKTMPVVQSQEDPSNSGGDDATTKNQIQGIVNDYNNIVENTKKKQATTEKKEVYNLTQMMISLSINGTHDNVMKFMKAIEDSPKHMNILNFNLSAQTDGTVTASMNIQLVAIPRIDATKEPFTTADDKYGKDNPFSGRSAVGTGTIETELANEKVENDFLMTVRPINSDLPTIVLGKADDKNKESYLMNDDNSVTNVEMYVSGKDGKYYYKYKVGSKVYPANFNSSEGTEFKPNGNDINFEIFSEKRLNNDDKSGVNIKIVNSSDKEVNLVINKDDEKNPRVNVTTEGKVKVIKN